MIILSLITYFYTIFKENIWVMSAMTGVRAAIVPIIASAAVNMVKGAFRFPPCFLVAFAALPLYLFLNVSCVALVAMGMIGGILICDIMRREMRLMILTLLELSEFRENRFYQLRRPVHDPLISMRWSPTLDESERGADIVAIAEMTPGPLGLNCATFAGIHPPASQAPSPPTWGFSPPPSP